MTLRPLALFTTAAATLLALAGPAAAADSAPAFASYWAGFIEHWSGALEKQNGIVLAALLVGAICLFIITRGKWRK
jgi:hypothetical protein